MRTSFLSALVFALLSNVSMTAVAVSASQNEVGSAAQNVQTPAQASSSKVDLNQADAATLQRELAGIGEAKAKAIVAYRESNGPFSSIDELLEVKGIGKAILEKNRGRLQLN
ncbi:ComEA family DNA-binding protein [Pseudomonas sp. TMB3-21]